MDIHGVRGIIHENGAGVDARAHLTSRPAQRRKELGVDESGLLVLEPSSYVPSDAEVGVLVDRARDQGGNLLHFIVVFAEDVREGRGERGASLYGREMQLPNIVAEPGIRKKPRPDKKCKRRVLPTCR